jgi:hypothetical protein
MEGKHDDRTEANPLGLHLGCARQCAERLHGATLDDLESSDRTDAVNSCRHRRLQDGGWGMGGHIAWAGQSSR